MSSLISEIEAFRERHGIPETKFGLLALNDKAFVGQLKAGRRMWPETEQRVRDFMANYTPEKNAA